MSAPRIFTPEYYDRMRALETGGWWNVAMRDVGRRLLAHVPLPESGRALDVGCGTGQTMDWLRAVLPEWRVTGLDLAREALTVARAAGGAGCRASALAIPHRPASADLVVLLDVLQHLPLDGGDVAALREVRRVLRPGGVLLVRTNAQAFPHTPDDPAADFHKYEPAELRAKLVEAGFLVVRLSRVNALLGLLEIPRELAARRRDGARYHGILAAPGRGGPGDRLKAGWLALEARAVSAGLRLPLGRSIVALGRAGGSDGEER